MVTMEEDPPVPSPAPPPPLPAEPTEVQEMEVDAGLMDGDRDSGAKAPPDAAAADDDVNDGNGDRPDGGADNSEAAPNPPTADPPADGEMVDANPPADDAPADGGMAAGVSPAEGEMANADTPAEDSDQGDQPPLTLATLSVPPGRLGVTLKMDPAGGARITKIDTSCPFRNKVKIGDRIISVDETTVKSIPDFLEGRDRDRELGVLTRRKKPGRPRGARATKRELRKSMEPACADPGRDTSGVHCSDEFLRYLKYKQKEPELVPAYRALKEAKERRDAAKKAVDERREEVAALNVALEAAKAGLEEGEAELEREEASFRAALDGVADVELKRECPWNESYRKLVAYREANGNIDLPARCREDPELDKLCLWVSRQKRQYRGYRYGEIKNERVSIGFVFFPRRSRGGGEGRGIRSWGGWDHLVHYISNFTSNPHHSHASFVVLFFLHCVYPTNRKQSPGESRPLNNWASCGR